MCSGEESGRKPQELTHTMPHVLASQPRKEPDSVPAPGQAKKILLESCARRKKTTEIRERREIRGGQTGVVCAASYHPARNNLEPTNWNSSSTA